MAGVATRYHWLLVLLHWVLAYMLIGSLYFGFFIIAPMANTDPEKFFMLQAHMIGGMMIVSLMAIRLFVRTTTAKPAAQPMDTAVYVFFYLLIFAMAATGLTTAILAGLPESIFQRSGAPLPASFLDYPSRIVHGWLAITLSALIAVHAVYAISRRLLGRMWFGRRKVA